MRNLQVEELEPRQLLNGAGWFPEPPPLQFLVNNIYTVRPPQHTAFIEHEWRFDLGGAGRLGEFAVEAVPAFGLIILDIDGPGPDAPYTRVPPPPNRLAPPPEMLANAVALAVADHQGADLDIALNPGPARVSTGAIAPVLTDVASAYHRSLATSTAAAHGMPSALPSPETAPDVDYPQVVVLPIATPPLASDVSPQTADSLAMIPHMDLSALEAGMQRFLEQVDGLAERLAGETGSGLYPWIAAAAAAAIACEIARRQLRRAPAPTGDAANFSGSPPDDLLAE
jgi:hypothetical protein